MRIISLFFLLIHSCLGATWYVATTGNNGNSCSAIGSPCASINGAYQKANSGDTIQVAAGTYGDQDMTPSAGKSSVVTAQPAPGADVNLGMLTIKGATYLEFRDMDATEFIVEMNSNFITIRNVNVQWLGYTGGSNITMIGGSVGPVLNGHPQIAPVAGWQGQGLNFVFDGVWFHDVTRNDPMYHVECLQVAGTTNMIIRNSKFQRCDIFDLSFTEYNGSGKVNNALLENNFFDTAGDGGYMSVHFTGMNGGTIRFNSATQAMVVEKDTSPNTGTMTILGNNVVGGILDGTSGACIADAMSATYRYNVTQGKQCDPTDANAAPGFVNAAALDLRLQTGATAINFVPTASGGPSADIDGVARPQGSARDAGASEFASAPPATPATYYVRSDGGNGTQCTGLVDAPYPGSGSAQPCAVNKPSIAASKSVALGGDIIQSRCSDTFRDSLIITNKGAAGNPNVYRNYGACTGTATTANNFPIIDGSILLPGPWTNTSGNIWTTTVAVCPVKQFSGSEGGNLWFNGILGNYKASAVAVAATRDWACSAGTLTAFSVGNPATVYTTPGVEATAVIAVDIDDAEYITITGYKIQRSLDYGIKAEGTSHHVSIVSNTIEQSAASGVGAFGSAGGSIISGNWIKNNGVIETGTSPHSHGIYAGGTNGPAVIEDNLIEGNYGWGIHPYMSSGVTARRNVVRNNGYAGILCADSLANAVTTYESNLIYGHPYNLLTVEAGVTNTPVTCNVRNNTLFGASQIGAYFTSTAASGVTYNFQNNIVAETSTQALQVEGPNDAAAYNGNFNNFYRAAGTVIRWRGTNYTTAQLATYKSATSKDANSIATDPSFVDAAATRFMLRTGSPAGRAGSDLGTGFGLHPRTVFPYGVVDFDLRGAWPIGAFAVVPNIIQ